MPTTPGMENPLEVEDEATAIQTALGHSLQLTRLDRPSAAQVLDELDRYHAVHFACHGEAHPNDPARSGLVLQKAGASGLELIQDRLTVQQLLERSKSAELAFLSACSTAENQVARLADEILHIASAFFAAGFSHVIGSMWPSRDDICVQVTRRFYAGLTCCGPNLATEASAYALHDAVRDIQALENVRCLALFTLVHKLICSAVDDLSAGINFDLSQSASFSQSTPQSSQQSNAESTVDEYDSQLSFSGSQEVTPSTSITQTSEPAFKNPKNQRAGTRQR